MTQIPVDEPSLVVLTPRGRGRPRVAEPRASVSTWLPASTHDRLIEIAKQHEVSVSEIVRSAIVLRLRGLV